MQRWITAILSSVLVAIGAAAPATAQLIGGGLTAQPTVGLSSDLVTNGGFETLNGGVPAGWGTGSGWAADQTVKHSGTFSYRRGTGSPTVSQSIALKKGIYNLSAWIKTQGLGSGSTSGVRLTMDMRPGVNEWHPSDVYSGTLDWTLVEVKNIVITQDMTVNISLENYNGAAGTAWFDDVKLVQQLPQGVDVFMLYPNFRGMLFDDGPSTMKFDVSVTPPSGDFSRYKVTGTLKDEATGQTLTTQDYPAAANFTAEMSGALMQTGKSYLVSFILVDQSNGTTASTYPAYRVSRAAAGQRGSMKIGFDDKNRFLMNGVPRFVLGVYDSGLGYTTTDSTWEQMLWSATGDRRMDGLRINLYLNYWYGAAPIDAMNSLMNNLQKRGVMYLQTGNCFDKYPADGGFQINASDTYVQQFGSAAGSAGYYTIDECISALIPGAFTQYDRLRRLDPDSVTFMANFGNADLVLWRDVVDVLSTDPYPLFGAEPAGGYNHGQVAQWAANTRTVLKDSRPFMTVLQFFQFTSQGRWPTRQEMRNHAYMAIVEGARGLFWWSLGDNALLAVCSTWCTERTNHMNDLKAVVGELADLEPALIADDAATALTTNSNPNAIKTKVKLVNGKGYLFAYNATNAQAGATFTWNTAPGTVTVNAEGRTLTASGNSFTDSFGPFQAHVYVIGNGGTGGSTGGTNGGTGGTGGTSAPAVSFTNPPASTTSVSGTVTVTLAGSGGSGTGYTYQLAVDGANVYTGSNGTFSWNTATLSNAGHTLTATVTDSAGQSGTATRTLTVSNATTTPPPAPTGSLQVFVTQPSAGATVTGTNWAVIWVSGTSGTSNAYTLSVGGQTVGTTTTSSTGPVSVPWNTTAVADGTQTLTASVKDATGNTGSKSVSLVVKNGTATVPPLTLAFSSPTAGATVSGTVNVGLSASGGSGSGYTYTLAVDSAAAATVASPFAWNTTTVANGSHTLMATVKDSAGRTATATRTVTVSNVAATPLTVAITAPTASTVSGTVTFTAAAAGGSGYTYGLAVDGTQVATTSSFSWNTTGVANGNHTLTATVTDASNRTATATKTVTVSNTVATPPPATGTLQVAVTQPSGGATVNGTNWAVIWVTGSTGTSTYTLTAGGTTVGSGTGSGSGPVSIPWNTTLVADGTQTLTVGVRDASGKTGSVNVSVNVRNSTVAPAPAAPAPTGTLQVAITQPTGGSTVSGTAWVVVWVNGASGSSNVFTLSVDGVAVATSTASNAGPVSLPWSTGTSANGSHTVTATVRDATGNSGSAKLAVTVSN
jgi:Bacterial Ig domain